MTTNDAKIRFRSTLAPLMDQFVGEKQACGYRYDAGARLLQRFDHFLGGEALGPQALPRGVSRRWLAKRPHESASTHQHRISVVRQFAQFMCRLGYPADVPDGRLAPRNVADFSPRILSHAEVAAILSAVDALEPMAQTPLRHLVMPEIFRLLYGCGFRVSELLQLRVADVDLDQGIITVREGKFRKDRLVPPAVPLVRRLQHYAAGLGKRPGDAVFFPTKHGGPWSKGTVYDTFRKLLYRCGIPHAGRGKGPRLHDLRHYVGSWTMSRSSALGPLSR